MGWQSGLQQNDMRKSKLPGSVEDVSSLVPGGQQHLHHRRDRLKQLRAFCQAARLGSISRAAEQVMSSQPAVSLQVRSLEEELGVRLFERRGPRIALTPVGRNLHRLARPLVEGMDRLPDTFAERHLDMLAGPLCIGAGQTTAACLLPRYLEQFREQYPEVRIEVRTGTGQERLGWLRDYELDLIVAAMDIPSPDVEFYPVLSSELLLITPLDHPLAGRDSVSVDEFTVYPFIGHTSAFYVRQITEVILRLRGAALDFAIEVDGWSAITRYVAAGAGIAFVPDLCLNERDQVWKISFKGDAPLRTYGAITRRDGLLGMAASRFLRIMDPERSNPPGKP